MKFYYYIAAIWMIIFSAVFIFLKPLESLAETFVSTFGLAGLFIFVLLIELTPQPLGPEAAFVVAGVSKIPSTEIMITVLIASILGSFADYFVGFYFAHIIQDIYEFICFNIVVTKKNKILTLKIYKWIHNSTSVN
jgi:membrane protein YqaA with SNARE-associated domain